MMNAPTLAHCVWPLPPKGALADLGRPGVGGFLPPTLAHCVWPLPPKGALADLGRPGVGG